MSEIYFDPTTSGFYFKELHGDSVPKNAIKTTEAVRQKWFDGQATGNRIHIGEDGKATPVLPKIETFETIMRRLSRVVQRYLDKTANDFGYDNIASAVSYADEATVPVFQVEGAAFRTWRSLVWAHMQKVGDDIRTKVRNTPSTQDLIAELPALELNSESKN